MRGFFEPGHGYAKDRRLSVSQDWDGPRRGELSASQERDGPGRGEPSRESQESRRDRDAVAEPSSSESSETGRRSAALRRRSCTPRWKETRSPTWGLYLRGGF